MELIFSTHNIHKVEEARAIVGGRIIIKSLYDIGCLTEIPETSNTLQGNALQKARFVSSHFQMDCFADDTGLEIEALDGRPGVYSARYAGLQCSFEDNVNKVLLELEGYSNRKACFKTVIALILDGKEYLFEGRVDGLILTKPSGIGGFGYDPIFMPDGFQKSFAELDPVEKNKISHRGIAMGKLMDFLLSLQ